MDEILFDTNDVSSRTNAVGHHRASLFESSRMSVSVAQPSDNKRSSVVSTSGNVSVAPPSKKASLAPPQNPVPESGVTNLDADKREPKVPKKVNSKLRSYEKIDLGNVPEKEIAGDG